MRLINCEQNSQEWLDAKLGVLSASNFGKLLTAKGAISKGATPETLIHQLAAERITGESEDTFTGSYWTERGHELEPKAVAYFEFITGKSMEKAGFILDKSGLCGCSPDRFNPESLEGLEIKCPAGKKHLQTVEAGVLPEEHKAQVQGCMMVTGAKSWWFMSYHPAFEKQLILEVKRDQEYIDVLTDAIMLAANKIKKLTDKYQIKKSA
jgi:putative phage-type endonuclease